MNKYIVAYLSSFDGNLTQKLVEGTSKRDAALRYLEQEQDVMFDECDLLEMESYDALLECCFNMDSHISVYEIKLNIAE